MRLALSILAATLGVVVQAANAAVSSTPTVKTGYIVMPKSGETRPNDCGALWDVGRGMFATSAIPNERTFNIVAHGAVNDTVRLTGWSELTMVAQSGFSKDVQRYAVGALEGFLTGEKIHELAENVKTLRKPAYFKRVMEHLREWIARIRIKMMDQPAIGDPFWSEIRLVMNRFDGLVSVMSNSCATHKTSEDDLLLVQFDGDVGDIESMYEHETSTIKEIILLALGGTRRENRLSEGAHMADKNDAAFWEKLVAQSKCSALVRRTSSGDVVLGHATWANYAEMVRMYKHIRYGNEIATSYSGFAGMIASTDDFYVTSRGLAITETSLNIIDKSSLSILASNKFKGVPSWVRTVVSCENANSGEEWVNWFVKENSDTYNCQWMILDRKRLNNTSGLLTVLETMPGAVVSRDLTSQLAAAGFFSSQNTPMFDETRIVGGYPDTIHQIATGVCKPCECFYSYNNNPRGCIFKRDATKVESVGEMRNLMRSNNWRSDPLSLNKPHESIAGRLDLNPPGPLMLPFGAIDAKVLSLRDDRAFTSIHVVGGIVVNEECPAVTSWSIFSENGIRHGGVPSLDGSQHWFQTVSFALLATIPNPQE